MNRIFLSALLASTAVATSAFAADMPVKARQMVIVDNWAGFYGGVFAGARITSDVWSKDESFGPNIDGNIGTFNSTDFIGGFISGVNVQSGKIVWGAETDIGFSTQNQTITTPAAIGISSLNQKGRYDSHLRLRVGYDLGQFMPFFAAGAAYSESKFNFVNFAGTLSTSQVLSRVGATVGGGIDWRFAPNWIARVEYLHDEYAPVGVGSSLVSADSHYFNASNDTVRAAVLYKTGNGTGPLAMFTKAPISSSNWAGLYVGAYGGGHRSNDKINTDEQGFFPQDNKSTGVSAGGLIGANFQTGSLIWGTELDAGYLSGTSQVAPGNVFESSLRGDGHARLRFGYDFGTFMPFTAGGVAVANVRTNNNLTQGMVRDSYRIGTSFGGGVDWAFAPNWIARAEYLSDTYAPAGEGFGDQVYYNLSVQTVRGALIYKFDGMQPRPVPMYAKAAPAIVQRWAGTYAGAFIGGHWSRDRLGSDETFAVSQSEFDAKPKGIVGGGLIGANLQLGRFVAGLEADIGGMSGTSTITTDLVGPAQFFTAKQKWDTHARMRFGYDAGMWMPFIAGGAAFTQSNVALSANTPPFNKDVYRAGATFGGGVDWAFNPSWIARVEYLHDEYGSVTVTRPGDSENFKLRNDTVRGAIIYKN